MGGLELDELLQNVANRRGEFSERIHRGDWTWLLPLLEVSYAQAAGSFLTRSGELVRASIPGRLLSSV
jgi:hypothetical protein